MQTIVIELKPSPLLLGLLAAVSMLSCVILAQLPLYLVLKWDLGIKLGLIALVLASSVYFALRDALLRLPSAWKRLEVSAQGVLKLTKQNGETLEPDLAETSLVHHAIIILNFKNKGLPPLILLSGFKTPQASAWQEELRKLRVWLRWFKKPQADDLSAA